MAKLMCVVVITACFFSAQSAFAIAGAGGTCPSGASYTSLTNPTGPGVTLSSLGITGCYFIAANGSDTNNGTSESSPWLHAPMMPNCSGTCATVQNQSGGIPAGTGIIFRGGDTWHFGNSSASPYVGGTWNINSGQYPMGTSSNPIYLGVDQTWYSGSSWARPIFNADNSPCNASTSGAMPDGYACTQATDSYGQTIYYVSGCAYQIGSTNQFVNLTSGEYFILDNFEMTGMCQSDLGQPSGHDVYIRYGSANGPLTFLNNYIHGWSHLQFAAKNGSAGCTASAVCFNILAFNGSVTTGSVGETVEYNVVDGSDADGAGAGLCFGGFYNVAYNAFRYTSQCITNGDHVFHDNLYEYFFENGHSNVFESLGESLSTNAVYDNVFRHIETAVSSGGGVLMWLLPGSGNTVHVFNNLMYDVGNLEYINIGNNATANGTYKFWNNTFQSNANQSIFNCSSINGSTFTLIDTNNHFIDGSSQYSTQCSFKTTTSALLLTNAAANADTSPAFNQYNASEAFAFSPVASTNSTVGAGTNEQSYCSVLSTAASSDSTLSDAASACQNDTPYRCGYVTSTHAVVCQASPSVVARPATAAWDIGAYQLHSNGPNPPQNPAAAVVQ